MPICDGVEATKRLRNLEAKRKAHVILPSMTLSKSISFDHQIISLVVALSADCQDSTKQLCLSAGMNAFFSKPLRKSKQMYFMHDHILIIWGGDLISLMSMFGQTAR